MHKTILEGLMNLWSRQFYDAINPQILRVGIDIASPGACNNYSGRKKTDFFDIIYVLKGKGSLKIDNQWFEHCPGDIIFILPGQIFQMEKADVIAPYNEYYVHVNPFGLPNHPAAKLLKSICPQKINLKNQMLPNMFRSLFEIFTTNPEDATIKLKSIMLQIIDIIFQHFKNKPDHQNIRIYTKILNAKKYIEENYIKEVTIDQISEHAEISSSYLMSKFKYYFGCSPISYKINLQMNHAKILLAQNTSVSKTACLTGFNSIHYFSRLFSKKTGMFPKQFAVIHSQKFYKT